MTKPSSDGLDDLVDWILKEPSYTRYDMEQMIKAWHKRSMVRLIDRIKSDIKDSGHPFTPLQDALDTVTMGDSSRNTINQKRVLDYLTELRAIESEVSE